MLAISCKIVARTSSIRACHEMEECIKKAKHILGCGWIPQKECGRNNNCNGMVGEIAADAVGELGYHSNDCGMFATIFIASTRSDDDGTGSRFSLLQLQSLPNCNFSIKFHKRVAFVCKTINDLLYFIEYVLNIHVLFPQLMVRGNGGILRNDLKFLYLNYASSVTIKRITIVRYRTGTFRWIIILLTEITRTGFPDIFGLQRNSGIRLNRSSLNYN